MGLTSLPLPGVPTAPGPERRPFEAPKDARWVTEREIGGTAGEGDGAVVGGVSRLERTGVYLAGMLGRGGVPEYWARRALRSGVPWGVEETEASRRAETMLTGFEGGAIAENVENVENVEWDS